MFRTQYVGVQWSEQLFSSKQSGIWYSTSFGTTLQAAYGAVMRTNQAAVYLARLFILNCSRSRFQTRPNLRLRQI